jgi:hypothetical protein
VEKGEELESLRAKVSQKRQRLQQVKDLIERKKEERTRQQLQEQFLENDISEI